MAKRTKAPVVGKGLDGSIYERMDEDFRLLMAKIDELEAEGIRVEAVAVEAGNVFAVTRQV